jgi:hypothetical protein
VPEATPTSRNTEKDLNFRISKYPKKAAWDRKDEEATLATLRAGEVTRSKSKPAPKVAQRDDDDDDAEYDEDDDDDEYEESSRRQEERDYSRSGASKSASDIFGNTDEYLFWTGMAFLAAAVGTGVVGFMQNSKYTEADEALKKANEKIEEAESIIRGECGEMNPDNDCFLSTIKFSKENEGEKLWIIDKEYVEPNKKAKDSYNKGRIIFFSAAAVSLAVSITLFVW